MSLIANTELSAFPVQFLQVFAGLSPEVLTFIRIISLKIISHQKSLFQDRFFDSGCSGLNILGPEVQDGSQKATVPENSSWVGCLRYSL